MPTNTNMVEVALDIEETLAAVHAYFTAQYNTRYGTDYTPEDITSYDWVRNEIDFETYMEITNHGWIHEYNKIKPREPNLSTVVDRLNNHPRITVDIVTAREGVEPTMQQWLEQHQITAYNEFIARNGSKAVFDYDYYIDDKPDLYKQLDDGRTHCLIDSPYAPQVTDNEENVVIVETVQNAVDYIINRI